MNKLNVKKGDTVVVISGKDKGSKGETCMRRPRITASWSRAST